MSHTNFEIEIRSTLARLEAKLDLLLNGNPAIALRLPTEDLSSDVVLMSGFTTKQHAIIQMMLRDADNEEIAIRLGVSPNTIKTHMAMIARKLGVQRRATSIAKLAPVYERISADAYFEASGGLPKDWDRKFREDDPVNQLVSSRA